MVLTRLPKELLDDIIRCSMPEGFESLALTCKLFYELCTPFIEGHNRLRWNFQRFLHRELWPDTVSWLDIKPDDPKRPIRTSFDLIARIAVEPLVARHIEEADLFRDSWPTRARHRQIVPDVELGGPVVALFASSPYLREVGLDWKEYYAVIKEDLRVIDDYSQHAATFLLTLLPNIRTPRLPRLWKPLDAANKLLDAIVRRAKQPYSLSNAASLAQPFLSLAACQGFTELGDGLMTIASPGPYHCLAENLQTIYLLRCCLDAEGITGLLKHTPRLRSLFYSHCTERVGSRDWDICKFVSAMEDQVGSHLIELSLSIEKTTGPIIAGKLSMRGFHCLQKLQLPLKIAMCGLGIDIDGRKGCPTETAGADEADYSISDLVSASVSRLRLTSEGGIHHAKALEMLFRKFAAEKDSKMPALKQILLDCPAYAGKLYEDRCDVIQLEAENASGNVEFLLSSSSSMDMGWEGKWYGIPFRKQKRLVDVGEL